MSRRTRMTPGPTERQGATAGSPGASLAPGPPDLERQRLSQALHMAHRMVGNHQMVREPLTAMERQHLRELIPVLAAAAGGARS